MAVEDVQSELPNIGDAYEFESVHVSSTPEGVSTMAAGDADMVLMTTVSYANSIAKQAVPGGVTAIATDFWDAHPNNYGFTTYAKADSEINGPKDLKGKKLGINATGTGIHAVYVKQLKQVGLDPENDVTFVELEFPAFTQAIKDGRFDVGIYPALLAGGARAAGFKEVFVSQDVFDAYPFAYYTASNNSLDGKGDAIRAWAEDLVQLFDLAHNSRDKIVPPAAKHFDIPEKAVDGYYFTEKDYFRGNLNMDIEALNGIMSQMVDLGFVDQQQDYSKYATNDYLPS